jgi:secondary thiamine-phosphate synthase enzyme
MSGRIGTVTIMAEGGVTRQALGRFTVHTPGPGFTELTEAAGAFVTRSGIADGLLSLFCRHTSASLTIQENADPDVRTDLMTALDGLAPRDAAYIHDAEGPDDMPAHIRAMLTGVSLAVPVLAGRLALGTWQGIYLVEHRDRPHAREIVAHVAGR